MNLFVKKHKELKNIIGSKFMVGMSQKVDLETPRSLILDEEHFSQMMP